MKKIFSLLIFIFALFVSANAAEGDYIIKFRADAPVFLSDESFGDSLGAGMQLVPADTALALKEAGLLEICDADSLMTYYDTPDDTYYSNQWNLPIIKAEYAWSLNTFGNSVLVGVIDSGLAANHPDIDYSRVEEGYNFGALPADEDYATNRLDTTDVRGHGTMVAGAIVAKRNNTLGICGIADKVKLLPLKVENKRGSIYGSSVIAAINAGAGYGCDILNISLGMDSFNSALNEAIENAISLGCIVIAAAGNDTDDTPGDHIRYPAGCDGVISVGSTTQDNTRAETSVTNESIFVCAPAAGIPLLHYSGSYATSGGTSFAAPQVTAAAAIAKSINPDLTPAEFADILKNTAVHPENTNSSLSPDEVRDIDFGYGILNIENMIKYMINGQSVYISPFDDETMSVTLFNRTGSKITASSFFALYAGNKMVAYGPKTSDIEIDANGSLVRTFDLPFTSGKLRHFLWESFETIAPYEAGQFLRVLIK